MHTTEPTIETIMRPPAHTVTPATPLNDARQIFLSETLRSLIVVDQNRPVGIVSWNEIGDLGTPTAEQRVVDVMAPDPPAVERWAPLSQARRVLESTDHDLIPVVDQNGALVGEAYRRELLGSDLPYEAAPLQEPRQTPIVHAGMPVTNFADEPIGTVEAVTVDAQGRVTHLDVKSGRLLKHSTRIPFDLVSRIEGDKVHLSIDKADLKRLPDV